MDRSREVPGTLRPEILDPEAAAPESDAQLAARFCGGDRSAFDLIVLRHQKDVYRLAWRITGDHAEADDLAQETFCRAWQALHGFRGDSSLRTWLMRIAMNLSLNLIHSARVTQRDHAVIEDLAEQGRPATVVQAAGPERLMQAQREMRLRAAIGTLPPRQRSTLLLRAFEGLPYKEIARVMGCTTGTAKANFFHAIAFLRRQMKEAP